MTQDLNQSRDQIRQKHEQKRRKLTNQIVSRIETLRRLNHIAEHNVGNMILNSRS